MEKLTEVVRVRVTPSEKERIVKEAYCKDLNISDFMRELLDKHFYVPSEDEVQENVFNEKIKALKVLTNADISTCKRALIDSNGHALDAIQKIKSEQTTTSKTTPKTPDMPEKLRIFISETGIEVLRAYDRVLQLTDDEIIKTNYCTMSMVHVDFKHSSDCIINYIDVISPVKPTKRAIYDNIVAYIQSLIKLSKDKNYEVKKENKWFSPIVAAEAIETALYDIIMYYEKNKTVSEILIKDYMKIIDNIHIDIYGCRQ